MHLHWIIMIVFLGFFNTRVEDYSKLSRDVWSWKGRLCIPVSFLRWSYFRRSPELGGTSSFVQDPFPRRLTLLRNRLFALRCWKTGSKSEPLNTCCQLLRRRALIIAGFKSRANVQMIGKSRFVAWILTFSVTIGWINGPYCQFDRICRLLRWTYATFEWFDWISML